MTEAEKRKAIDLALAAMDKQFGRGTVLRLGADNVVPVSVISSGCLSLDSALGVGGFPRGRVIEVFGPESSGKTTLALQVIAQAQKVGGAAAFVDAEHALDPIYAGKLGVDVDNLLVSQPDTVSRLSRLRAHLCSVARWMWLWWIRWRHWFPRRNSKAKWATATWDCTRG